MNAQKSATVKKINYWRQSSTLHPRTLQTQRCEQLAEKFFGRAGHLSIFFLIEIESINEETFAIKHQPNKIGEIAAVSYGSRPIDSYRKGYQHSNSYRRSYTTRQPTSSWNKGGSSQHTTDRFSSNHRERCWRCSGNYHLPEDCHAANKRCHNCQVVRHIERACRLKPQHLTKRRTTETTEPAQTTKTRKIAAISDNNCLDGSEHEERATNFNTQPEVR